MVRPWVIYVLLDAAGTPFYVGYSSNLPRRLREHKRVLGYKPSYHLAEFGCGYWRVTESKWIEHYRSLGFQLLNRTVGGNGCQTLSEEARCKLSANGKGKQKPAGFGQALSRTTKGVPHNWNPIGEVNASATRFPKGHKRWELLSEDEKAAIYVKRRATLAAYPERKAAHRAKVSALSKANWERLTKEERSALGRKVAEARKRNHTPEELSAIASANSRKALEKPGARERLSSQIRTWWSSLTPEAKEEYVARRAERIRQSKAKRRGP